MTGESSLNVNEIAGATSKITYGLYIISSFDGERHNGQIVNTVFQATASHPRVAASLNKNNLTHAYVEKNGLYAVCKVCGYIYDPAAGDPGNNVPPDTVFEKLSEGWVCPVCGAAKKEFEQVSGETH